MIPEETKRWTRRDENHKIMQLYTIFFVTWNSDGIYTLLKLSFLHDEFIAMPFCVNIAAGARCAKKS